MVNLPRKRRRSRTAHRDNHASGSMTEGSD
jgi:hypothetical protein